MYYGEPTLEQKMFTSYGEAESQQVDPAEAGRQVGSFFNDWFRGDIKLPDMSHGPTTYPSTGISVSIEEPSWFQQNSGWVIPMVGILGLTAVGVAVYYTTK